MSRPSKMHSIAQKMGKPIEDVLSEYYFLYGNQTNVANALGVGQSTLSVWLLKLGLQEKTILVPRQEVTQDARHT